MNFKSLFVTFMVFCMMLAPAMALVPFTGNPGLPYLVFGFVESNGQQVYRAQVAITNEATGYTKTITTNEAGYWQEETGNWLTNYGGRPPVQFGDNIVITAITGCGASDTCTKSFGAFTPGYDDYAKISFSLTGDAPAPTPPPPPSSGGGGSGSGSNIKWDCEEWSACDSGEKTRTCDNRRGVTKTETLECEYVAPTPTPEQLPPQDDPIVVPVTLPPEDEPVTEPPVEPPEDEGDLFIYLLELAGVILGALGVQWYRGILGIVKYHWQAGRKGQAIKTLFTLIKRAKTDYYKKE